MSEQWKPVVGYEGHYEVSDLGRIRSLDRPGVDGRRLRGVYLTPYVMPSGHLRVALCKNRRHKTEKLHRLVLIAFVGQPPPGMEVLHRDGNPANNSLANLRWGTKSENARDQIRHGVHPMARKTHCPKGHPYDENNTYRRKNSSARQCKTCVLAAQKIAYQLRKNQRKAEVD